MFIHRVTFHVILNVMIPLV